MPYKHINKKIPRELNKNVKLSLEDREKIREAYIKGGTSQRKLATKWSVSRRLIQFILDEKKAQRNKELRKAKNNLYYDRDKHKEYMKTHRRHKQNLYLKGFLED